MIYWMLSRHTVVCCVAQEASTPHPWVINRKNTFTKVDNFCSGNACQCHYLTFQILTKLHQTFPKYEPSKIGWVSYVVAFSFCFPFFSSNNKIYANMFSDCPEIWYTDRQCKGASWYQIWLYYHKWSQSYKKTMYKNNTNMLSNLQGKLLMGRSWKSAMR